MVFACPIDGCATEFECDVDETYKCEAWLRHMYEYHKLSSPMIAKAAPCSKKSILNWLGRHGIPIRTAAEAANRRARSRPELTDPHWLYYAVYRWGMSPKTIGDLLRVTSQVTRKALKDLGFPMLGAGYMRKEKVRVRCGYCGEWLKELVYPYRLKTTEKFFLDHKECQSLHESQKRGPLANGWKGGHDPYYGYDWALRSAQARGRDGTCQVPGCGKAADAVGRELDVHHVLRINRVDEVVGIDNSIQLLVSLCREHHTASEHDFTILPADALDRAKCYAEKISGRPFGSFAEARDFTIDMYRRGIPVSSEAARSTAPYSCHECGRPFSNARGIATHTGRTGHQGYWWEDVDAIRSKLETKTIAALAVELNTTHGVLRGWVTRNDAAPWDRNDPLSVNERVRAMRGDDWKANIAKALQGAGVAKTFACQICSTEFLSTAGKAYQCEDWLRHMYEGHELCFSDIAKFTGCAPGTVGSWAKRLGIERRTAWTESSDQFVIENYGKITAQKIADHLHLSLGRIYGRAEKLGLKSELWRPGSNGEEAWTPEQDRRVTEDYPTGDTKAIATALNRTVGAIHTRASLLKVKGDRSKKSKRGAEHHSYQGGKTQTVCAQCGRAIEVWPYELRTKKHLFCRGNDSACRGIWISENQCGENATNWRGGKVTVACDWCGKPVEVGRWEIVGKRARQHHFCRGAANGHCQSAWRSANIRGAQHPRWKSKPALPDIQRCTGTFRV